MLLPPHIHLEIVEAPHPRDTDAIDAEVPCRLCRADFGGGRAKTWTIHLLVQCQGECGSWIQHNHVTAVHSSSVSQDLAGIYHEPEEIPDPVLRAHAQALIQSLPSPNAPWLLLHHRPRPR